MNLNLTPEQRAALEQFANYADGWQSKTVSELLAEYLLANAAPAVTAATPIARVMGKWPGDETDSQVDAGLLAIGDALPCGHPKANYYFHPALIGSSRHRCTICDNVPPTKRWEKETSEAAVLGCDDEDKEFHPTPSETPPNRRGDAVSRNDSHTHERAEPSHTPPLATKLESAATPSRFTVYDGAAFASDFGKFVLHQLCGKWFADWDTGELTEIECTMPEFMDECTPDPASDQHPVGSEWEWEGYHFRLNQRAGDNKYIMLKSGVGNEGDHIIPDKSWKPTIAEATRGARRADGVTVEIP